MKKQRILSGEVFQIKNMNSGDGMFQVHYQYKENEVGGAYIMKLTYPYGDQFPNSTVELRVKEVSEDSLNGYAFVLNQMVEVKLPIEQVEFLA